MGQETKKCSDCKRQIPVRGPPEGFSPVLLRAYLAGCTEGRRHQGTAIWEGHKTRWTCFQCQYPFCKLCQKRPEKPRASNSKAAAGEYICPKCRYPPCAGGCGAPRPEQSKYNVINWPGWKCAKCRDGEPTQTCMGALRENIARVGM